MARVLSAIVLLPLLLAAIWFLGPFGLLVVTELVLVLAVIEYARLSAGLGAEISTAATSVAAGAVCAAAAWQDGPVLVALTAGTLGLAAIAIGSPSAGSRGLTRTFSSVFAMAYLGLPLGAFLNLRHADGREAVFALLLTVAASDTAQYYTGRLFGRRRLAPAISPKKTVEGAAGGLVAGPLVMVLLGAWWRPGAGVLPMAALGLVVTSFGMLGDLFESLMKRSAGVKDSSALIPGHGGVLDRIDALLFAAPPYYIVLRHGFLQ